MEQVYLAIVKHSLVIGCGLAVAGLFYGCRHLVRQQIKRGRQEQADFDAKMAAEFADVEDIPFEMPTIVFCGDRCLWSDRTSRDGEK